MFVFSLCIFLLLGSFECQLLRAEQNLTKKVSAEEQHLQKQIPEFQPPREVHEEKNLQKQIPEVQLPREVHEEKKSPRDPPHSTCCGRAASRRCHSQKGILRGKELNATIVTTFCLHDFARYVQTPPPSAGTVPIPGLPLDLKLMVAVNGFQKMCVSNKRQV